MCPLPRSNQGGPEVAGGAGRPLLPRQLLQMHGKQTTLKASSPFADRKLDNFVFVDLPNGARRPNILRARPAALLPCTRNSAATAAAATEWTTLMRPPFYG